jgi:hypothetical protein
MPYVPPTSYGRAMLRADGAANKLFLAFLFANDVGVQFLKDVGLIRSAMVCHKCGSQMAWCVNVNQKDAFRCRCRRILSASTSIRHGTWFQQSRLFSTPTTGSETTYTISPITCSRRGARVKTCTSVSSSTSSRARTGVFRLTSQRIQPPRHIVLPHILRLSRHPPQVSVISPSIYMPYSALFTRYGTTHHRTIFLRSSVMSSNYPAKFTRRQQDWIYSISNRQRVDLKCKRNNSWIATNLRIHGNGILRNVS